MVNQRRKMPFKVEHRSKGFTNKPEQTVKAQQTKFRAYRTDISKTARNQFSNVFFSGKLCQSFKDFFSQNF